MLKRLAILVGRALEQAGVALLRWAEYQTDVEITVGLTGGPAADVTLGLSPIEIPLSPVRAHELGAALVKAAHGAQIERDRARLPLRAARHAGVVH